MPFGEIKLVPGVNVERTPTLLEAGFSASQLIRFRDGLVQKYGGWARFFSAVVPGVIRDLHAWQDLNAVSHLLTGSTTQLGIITSGILSDITPQTKTTNPTVDFSTVSGSNVVTIVDAGVTSVTVLDVIFLSTPIAVGGIVLSGAYQITNIVGPNTYKINAASNATATANNGGVVPNFTTTSGSASVSVAIPAHALAAADAIDLNMSTTANGITMSGHYIVTSITDANNFTVTNVAQATASSTFPMNTASGANNAQIIYYIALGPPAAGSGWGLGGYGLGGWGTGAGSTSNQTGTAITATDWTSDNWGEIALASPRGGGVYQYDPSGGFSNAGLVATAPIFNNGIFVSSSLQILFCWGSAFADSIGVVQDPMNISWSDLGDYTNFTVSTTTQAGSFRIPIGSVIRAGMAVSNQNLFWTDLDLWAANYCGFPLVFGFNKIGSGAGAVSSHAVQQLRNGVFWMGPTNFYSYSGEGVKVLPCPVWDFVFQNLNTTYQSNVRAMPNTPFNEVGWLFPSTASVSGENDCYVKMNLTEPGQPWDYGPASALPRSAWIDQTILGMPISASGGNIYSQETTRDAEGAPITSSFTTGYFYIGEGEEYAFVDEVIPDMKWDYFGGSLSAQVFLTFNVINYPGDTPVMYGPYLVTSATEYITVRFRGRQMSVTLLSADLGSFWRIGKIRYRYAPAGRR